MFPLLLPWYLPFTRSRGEERGYHETRVIRAHRVKNTCVTGLKISRPL